MVGTSIGVRAGDVDSDRRQLPVELDHPHCLPPNRPGHDRDQASRAAYTPGDTARRTAGRFDLRQLAGITPCGSMMNFVAMPRSKTA